MPPIALNDQPPLVVEGAPIFNGIAGDPTAREKNRGSIDAPRESLRRLRREKLPFGQAVGAHDEHRSPLLPAADKAFWPSGTAAAEHPPGAEERDPDGDRQAARRKKSVDDRATNHPLIFSILPPHSSGLACIFASSLSPARTNRAGARTNRAKWSERGEPERVVAEGTRKTSPIKHRRERAEARSLE